MNERKSSYSNGTNCIEVGQEWATTKQKSSHSIPEGHCTEVGQTHGVIVVGDTKDPDGPKITVRPIDWDKFLAGVRDDGSER